MRIQVNIAIMRAFVKVKELLTTHKELAPRNSLSLSPALIGMTVKSRQSLRPSTN